MLRSGKNGKYNRGDGYDAIYMHITKEDMTGESIFNQIILENFEACYFFYDKGIEIINYNYN